MLFAHYMMRLCDSVRLRPIPDRVGSFIENLEIGLIAENPAPLAAGDFFDDAKTLKVAESGVDRGSGQTGTGDQNFRSCKRILLKPIMDPQG